MIWWSISIVLGALAVLVLGLNIAGIIRASLKRESYSSVPFLAGIFAVAALLTLPVEGAGRFWWLPLIIDYTIPGFLYAVAVKRAFRR